MANLIILRVGEILSFGEDLAAKLWPWEEAEWLRENEVNMCSQGQCQAPRGWGLGDADGGPVPDHLMEMVQALHSKLVAPESYQNSERGMDWQGNKSCHRLLGHQPGPISANTSRELGHPSGAIESLRTSHSGQGLAEHFQLFMELWKLASTPHYGRAVQWPGLYHNYVGRLLRTRTEDCMSSLFLRN